MASRQNIRGLLMSQPHAKLMAYERNAKLNLYRMNFTFMLPWTVIVFFLNNQPDTLIIQILFCYKTLHVSGILSAHHSFVPFLVTISEQSQDGNHSS